ncbi:phage Gp19/Gp15/Gp42 family protein [Enterococcus faecium]|nr:phage Gp19/Gp15/Gp42 family protein [Enterococcus hirae]EMF0430243.1 phage Gp19/Gp15/Gp42 family protein [Enterococcus faecium]
MQPFASIEDLENLWRKLKPDETERAKQLLIIVSDSLREEAGRVGKDLDKMINEKPPYFTNVVKSVTVDVVARTLMTSTDQEPMTQTTESALGYSWSGSYLVPGGGLFIKNTELSRLGLRRQRYGVIDFYGQD